MGYRTRTQRRSRGRSSTQGRGQQGGQTLMRNRSQRRSRGRGRGRGRYQQGGNWTSWLP